MQDEMIPLKNGGGIVRKLVSFFKGSSDVTLRESLEEAIDEHEEETKEQALGDEEKTMLFNILEYGSLRVGDVMVPRADVIAVNVDTSLPDLIKLFADASHSRVPVYRDALDEVLGMVHVKDVLMIIAQTNPEKDFRLSQISRPVLFVPESMRVMDLLAKMRASRTHMAIVVDEYGGTDGLVTIEDLVEEIVGEIEDEHDAEDDAELVARNDGKFDADARIEIEDLESVLGLALVDDDDDDVDTLGGLVFTLAGRVPDIGEIIDHESGYRFEVVDADPRRIDKIRIHAPL